jgi:hypothetical protein
MGKERTVLAAEAQRRGECEVDPDSFFNVEPWINADER